MNTLELGIDSCSKRFSSGHVSNSNRSIETVAYIMFNEWLSIGSLKSKHEACFSCVRVGRLAQRTSVCVDKDSTHADETCTQVIQDLQ